MFKRIGLFILTNLAILVMLSIILNLVSWFFGVDFSQIAGAGQNYVSLLIFAAVIGFSGSIISLMMSKTIAKNSMGVQMIDIEHPRNEVERWLVQTVAKLAETKGVAMPEVGIYHGEPNAFATGPSKNNSLVAVSDGLLASMNKEEVAAVLGHEMSHVANGDMVTMTLMQGVINTFVVFLSRVIGNIVDRGILRNESDAPGAGYYITSLVLDMVLGLLGSMLVAAFSRYREYRADAGAAEALGSPVPMINALARLGGQQPSELPGNVKGFGISVSESMVIRKGFENLVTDDEITQKIGLPCFVKPNAGGSSFGVTKVKKAEDIRSAISKAMNESDEVMIESFMAGTEITCGCYKTKEKEVVLPITEVVTSNEFFDYDAKYNGQVKEITPARLSAETAERVRLITSAIYDILGCSGLIRIDYIITKKTDSEGKTTEKVNMLEINTTPGMTATSFIPQQVKAAGLDMKNVLTDIIEDKLGRTE